MPIFAMANWDCNVCRDYISVLAGQNYHEQRVMRNECLATSATNMYSTKYFAQVQTLNRRHNLFARWIKFVKTELLHCLFFDS